MTGVRGPVAADEGPSPENIRNGVEGAQKYLLSIQQSDGHWCGELEGDTILESEYVLAMFFQERLDDPKVLRAANTIRRQQLDDGGWAQYPGGKADVSVSAKAYFVLKLVGDDAAAEHMRRACATIRLLGGIDACNSFTKIYLAIFGQYPWGKCPNVPPETILLPRWFYINLYEMSSWSRAIIVPLSIVSAMRPRCEVPSDAAIAELLVDGYTPPSQPVLTSVFVGLSRLVDRFPFRLSRPRALRRAEEWILQRLEDSDGLGAIFPPIVNTIFALRALGYAKDHPTICKQMEELRKLEVEDGDELRVQPCFSPVWDTALASSALVDSGLSADHPALLSAAEWLLHRRGHGTGDWRVKNRRVESPGWYFEYANPFYPDLDTTAQTIVTLRKLDLPTTRRAPFYRAIEEAHQWHLSMQNRDGGWGAFDRDCDKGLLTRMPFADHNAMIDPSTADLTARGIEALASLGHDHEHPAVRRAVVFLLSQQEVDGSWFGRWGCNYVYGTWLAAWSLRTVGVDPGEPWGRNAAHWLKSVQNDDGGWGELPDSYEDPRLKGIGPSTASQTAWALLGLIALDEVDSPVVRRGVEFLLETQAANGSWHDEYWTGTGFPRVFYLRYHLYAVYFPLIALGNYERAVAGLAKGQGAFPAAMQPTAHEESA